MSQRIILLLHLFASAVIRQPQLHETRDDTRFYDPAGLDVEFVHCNLNGLAHG